MFDKSAHLYDLFYEKGLGKDYAAEARLVTELLPPATTTLLDVACGTGAHLEHLSARYDCAGVDLDPRMLEIARARCPDVELVEGDMVEVRLDRRFDAVICLFSSIGYVRTEERLRRAVANLAAHLAPGGTLLVEPWLQPGVFLDRHVHALHVDEPELKMTRISTSRVVDGCSQIEFHYLVGTPDGVDHFTEQHTLGLFTWDQYRDAFERAGLDTTIDEQAGPMGRGLVTGRQAGS